MTTSEVLVLYTTPASMFTNEWRLGFAADVTAGMAEAMEPMGAARDDRRTRTMMYAATPTTTSALTAATATTNTLMLPAAPLALAFSDDAPAAISVALEDAESADKPCTRPGVEVGVGVAVGVGVGVGVPLGVAVGVGVTVLV
jgi:hypothetical protein